MKQAQFSRIRTMATLSALAALALVAVALTGCNLVGDSLTGVRVTGEGATTCLKDCNDFYKEEFEREQKLHDENVNTCLLLEQPDKEACLEAEAARHGAAMLELGQAKVECQNDCHRQGAGSAG